MIEGGSADAALKHFADFEFPKASCPHFPAFWGRRSSFHLSCASFRGFDVASVIILR